MVNLLEAVGMPKVVGFQADMSHTHLYTLGANAEAHRIVPKNYHYEPAAFHAAIARATGNDYFLRFTQFLGVRLVPSRKLYLQGSDPKKHQRHARTINRDHEAIYAAIEGGDANAARRAARQHMQKSVKRYEDLKAAGAPA